MPYEIIGEGVHLSPLVTNINTAHAQMRSLERSDDAGGPTVKPTGLIHNVTDEGTYGEALRRWNGSAWEVIMPLGDGAAIVAGGTVAMAANFPMGGHKITGLGAGTAVGHAVRYEQAMLLSGANAMAGNLAMGSNRITGLAAPTDPSDAARLQDAGSQTWSGLEADVTVAHRDSFSADYNEVGFVPKAIDIMIRGGGFGVPSSTPWTRLRYIRPELMADHTEDQIGEQEIWRNGGGTLRVMVQVAHLAGKAGFWLWMRNEVDGYSGILDPAGGPGQLPYVVRAVAWAGAEN